MSCLCKNVSNGKACKMTIMATPDVCIFHMRQFQKSGGEIQTVDQWNRHAAAKFAAQGNTKKSPKTRKSSAGKSKKTKKSGGRPWVQDMKTYRTADGAVVTELYSMGKLHSRGKSKPAVTKVYPDGRVVIEHYCLGKLGMCKKK